MQLQICRDTASAKLQQNLLAYYHKAALIVHIFHPKLHTKTDTCEGYISIITTMSLLIYYL